MIASCIKNFSIIICSLYIYRKLLNLKSLLKNTSFEYIFAIILSISIYYVKVLFPPLVIPVIVILSILFMSLFSKTELGLSMTTMIISFGISYVLFAISVIINAIIFRFTGTDYLGDSDNVTDIYLLCIAFLQFLLVIIPFRFRRLKSGMPFLRNKGGSNLGISISVFLLCCVIVISAGKSANLAYLILTVCIMLSGVLILFWWRSRLNRLYIEKLKAAEIKAMQTAIDEKEARILLLEQHNDFLAKVIHKDNKLIPAMELAVRDYLQTFSQSGGEAAGEKGQKLLAQLQAISCERAGIIDAYQSENKKLPLTEVLSVDALMTYMLRKSQQNGIEFELTISGSVKYMAQNILSESDLSTLLADLIENAIIATGGRTPKKILVSIGIADCHFVIDVFDSGIPFQPETLVQLGLKKITTHADNGGSGIGLTTAFEIFKKYSASFMIEEFSDTDSLYTKKVSVIFDSLGQYSIKPAKMTERNLLSQREDLIVLT